MVFGKETEITHSNLVLQKQLWQKCTRGNMTIFHGTISISIDFYFPMEIKIFLKILKFYIPMGFEMYVLGIMEI